MIPKDLIKRYQENLEALAKGMPEKFTSEEWLENFRFSMITARINTETEYTVYTKELVCIRSSQILIQPDPQQVYLNANGRIIKEAFGEEISPTMLNSAFTNAKYPEPLSREIYVICLLIEKRRKENE